MTPHQFRIPVRIYWEDTDASGVVYHGNYARFFDRARTDWLRSSGLDQLQLAEAHHRLVMVRRMDMEFHKPARLDDLCWATCRLIAVKKVSLTIEQCLVSQESPQDIMVRSTLQLACLDTVRFRPASFPGVMLDFLENQISRDQTPDHQIQDHQTPGDQHSGAMSTEIAKNKNQSDEKDHG